MAYKCFSSDFPDMEPFVTMQRSDSGLSSCSTDTLSSRDFRVPPSSLDLIVEAKVKQMEQISDDISSTKEKFLKKYQDMNQRIDDMLKQIYINVQARKRELETQLQEIVNTEVTSWNRQLKICEEAGDWLQNIKVGFSPFGENFQETCRVYVKDIGFISSPQVGFDDDYSTVQNYFGNIGRAPRVKIIQEKRGEKINPKFCIGRRGENAGEFGRPWGVCTDATGRILVADRGNNRVQIFNEHGRFLLEFGKTGRRPGEFNKPVGITVDKKFRIIVTDKNNHRVQVFTFSGGFMFMFGRKGSKPGQFQFPWDVDTNSGGDIAVSDTKNHRVQLFTKNGVFLSEFRFTSGVSGLDHPVCPLGVAFKPDGTLLVTDFNNHAVFKINDKFSTAVRIQNCLRFFKPQGVACNSYGRFIIADGKYSRIQVFDEQEKLHRVLEIQGKPLGEFDNPQGVCLHPNGSIIVTDFGNNRIQVL